MAVRQRTSSPDVCGGVHFAYPATATCTPPGWTARSTTCPLFPNGDDDGAGRWPLAARIVAICLLSAGSWCVLLAGAAAIL